MTVAAAERIGVFIAYRRGPDEGDACALWVQRALDEATHRTDSGAIAFKPFVDRYAPPLSDWREMWRGELQTARALVLVCTRGVSQPREGQDWLHEEIDWWLDHRRTSPILIDAAGSAPADIPRRIRERWPHTQWLTWHPALTADEERRLRASLADGVLLSERSVSYQELRRLSVRNRALTILLLLAIGLGGWVLMARNTAERNRVAAVARALANEGYESYRDGRFNRAAWLAAEAIDLGGGADADGALRDSLSRLPRRVLRFDATGVLTAVPSPRGDVFLVLQSDGVISMRRTRDGTEVLRFTAEHATAAAWFPDGDRIVVAGGTSEVRIGRRRTLVPLPRPREPRSSGFCDIWSVSAGSAKRLGGIELPFPPKAVRVVDAGARITVVQSMYSKDVYRVTPDFSLVAEGGASDTFNASVTSGLDVGSQGRYLHIADGISREASDDLREVAIEEGPLKDSDGNYMLDRGSPVAVLDAATRQVIERVRFDSVGSTEFSPDRRYLAHQTRGMLQIWDRQTARMILRREFDGDPQGLRFSPNSRYVAINLPNHRLVIWRLGDRAVLDAPDAEVEAGGDLEIGNEGTLLVPQGSYDDIFQLAGADAFSDFRARGGSVVISGDGNLVAYEPDGEQYSIAIADVVSGAHLGTIKGYYAIEFSPDNKWLLARSTVNENPPTRVLSVPDGAIVRELGPGMAGGSFRASGQSVISRVYSVPNDKFAVVDITTGKSTVLEFPEPPKAIGGGNAGQLAVILNGINVQLWDAQKHATRWTAPLNAGFDSVRAQFSPDGHLLTVYSGTACWVLDVAFGGVHWRKEIDRPEPVFSPDGRLIRFIQADGVLVVDAVTGKERARIRQPGTVQAEFSPDSQFLATASEAATATVWSVRGSEVARLRNDLPVRDLLFDPAGRYLMLLGSSTQMTVSHDHDIRLVRWKTADVRAQLCERLNQAMSRVEWDAMRTGAPYHNLCPSVPIRTDR